MITYSINFMGPISLDWYRQRGLTHKVTRVVEEDDFLVDIGSHQVGDVIEYEEVTTYYCGGRIDIRDDTKHGYDGWHEYSLPPMHGEDWNALGDWLWDLTTEELLPYNTLIEQFEEHYDKKIRWMEK